LRVVGRRADGFHDVETLLLPLETSDLVEVTAGAGLTVEVCGERAAELAAAGGESLALSAARALVNRCGVDLESGDVGATIRIDKRIPVAAGLGGGSSDAAAALLALRELWGCAIDEEGLADVAATIGSDVPALLRASAVYVTGRGERVHAVHAPTTWWVVRPFQFAVRTPDAYAWWDEDGDTGPDPGALVAALETANHELLGDALFDDLQAPVANRHPEIEEAVEAFLDAGAIGAVMSGSGPTVVALARHLGHADRIAAAIPGSFVTSGPPRELAPPERTSVPPRPLAPEAT
jgi:4-diphosphocytidyl-2-C-methyl-D-erythritol kinase